MPAIQAVGRLSKSPVTQLYDMDASVASLHTVTLQSVPMQPVPQLTKQFGASGNATVLSKSAYASVQAPAAPSLPARSDGHGGLHISTRRSGRRR